MGYSSARWKQVLWLWAGAVLVQAGIVAQAETPSVDLWMVRTHEIPIGGDPSEEIDRLNYFRFDAGGTWTASSRQAFFTTREPQAPTVVFAHGALTDDALAGHLALQLACVLRSRKEDRPVRVVLWKWPSQGGRRRPRRALKASLARADFDGKLLGRWLQEFDLAAPRVLVGWSAGCRVAVCALKHLAAAGSDGGNPADRHRFRVMLAGAALDADALRLDDRRNRALDVVQRMIVVHHRRDPVLRFYPPLIPGPRPVPIGLVGITCPRRLGEARDRVETLDLTCCIRGRHYFGHYLDAPSLAASLDGLVFRPTQRTASEGGGDAP